MTPEETLHLIKRLRENGVTFFKSADFSCRIEALPKKQEEMVDSLREMQPEERKRLLKEAERDLERDLYGAVAG